MSISRLESVRLFTDRPADYFNAQKSMHKKKACRSRTGPEYPAVASLIKSVMGEPVIGPMICLGTRNSSETTSFKDLLGIQSSSLDIIPDSNADYILDFTDLPDTMMGKWRIVYSNSLDHSFDPTSTLDHWLGLLTNDGVLFLGFDLVSDFKLNPADCSKFSEESIMTFIAARNDLEILGRCRADYDTLAIRKLT